MAQKLVKRKTAKKSTYSNKLGLASKMEMIEKSMMRNDLPAFTPGDTVKVHVRIKEGDKERIQIYEGVVLGRSNKGAGKSFRVRKMSHCVGVERVFLESSPKVAKVEIAHTGKSRRAKLYYLRELEGKAAKLEREMETRAEEAPAATPEKK
jgi:large subunit ribosomal protein L19